MPLQFPPLLTTRWSASDPSLQYPVYNPATGELITTVQAGNKDSVHKAVLAAQAAFENDWRWRSPMERSALLFACADALSSRKEEIAEILCLENGKPYADALQFDVNFLIGVFKYFASLVDKLPGEHYDQGPTCSSVYYEPFGVCAGIVPFNWPPIHTGGKTAPALAAGNTLVLKPAEQAPLTLMRIVDIISEVLPKDVVQVVPGLGTAVPQALIDHHLVKMVSFTGSSPAGAKVAEAAGRGIKPVVLELGGKNAFVVFDDVDLDKVVPTALEGAFFNKGEACTASSRFLVQRKVYDEFCSRLAAAVTKLKCGNGMDPSTHVGPVVSKEQKERVEKHIKVAQDDSQVHIAAQSETPTEPNCKNGYFVPPTLITNVSRDHVLAKEEIFGPVATVTPFDTEEEAVSIVNESEYGLTCAIFSNDHETCLRASRKVDVGMVFINNYFRSVLGQPFGGTKSTGFGREHCIETLRSWAQPKVVKQPSGLGSVPSWRAIKDIF
ncbi:uncharacterized protein PFLUO_LOCUS3260 [Penicillium psychrofluorescens]|uniref:uncharacterized protein n=1 Tax=Penicillium psychrofluorescens TaxID=3158075 RepID=UPI003CCCBC9D